MRLKGALGMLALGTVAAAAALEGRQQSRQGAATVAQNGDRRKGGRAVPEQKVRPACLRRQRRISDSFRVLAAALAFSAMASANAATIQLRAWLDGAQEVPPVATAATGLATVTYDTVTGQLSWNVSYGSLSSAINDAHFDGPTPAGFDAGITVQMTAGPSPIIGSATISPTQATQLLSGQWYVNLPSNNFSGGEIRGQVVPVRGDLNGDGNADIVWRNAATGQDYIYLMNGSAIAGEGFLRAVADQNWQIAGIGDFDGDGKADILWRNSSTGENYVYLMNGTTIAGEGFLRTVADLNWKVVGIGDFNGDGKADILWRNVSTGENYIYPMNGTTILGTEGYVRTVADLNWQVAGVGDFDGDGKADIVWRNASTGENYIYPMNGTTILGTEGYIRTLPDLNWQIAGIGDFDGDGKADMLWRNASTGENYIYPMNGTTILGTEGYIRTVADLTWRVGAVGDYNGDGKADILWRNAWTGQNYLYPMNGTTILGTEGYIRTVMDLNWQVAGVGGDGSSTGPKFAALAWDAVADPTLSGYRIYYGTAPGTYLQSVGQGLNVGSATTFTVTGLSSGTRYYFAATAYDTLNNESTYSNEVFKDIP